MSIDIFCPELPIKVHHVDLLPKAVPPFLFSALYNEALHNEHALSQEAEDALERSCLKKIRHLDGFLLFLAALTSYG